MANRRNLVFLGFLFVSATAALAFAWGQREFTEREAEQLSQVAGASVPPEKTEGTPAPRPWPPPRKLPAFTFKAEWLPKYRVPGIEDYYGNLLDPEGDLLIALKMGPDFNGLAAYLDTFSNKDEELEKVDHLVAQLSSESFKTREQAAVAIKRLGQAALPSLRAARDSKDLELTNRVWQCLDHIEPKYSWAEQHSAVAVLLRDPAADPAFAAALMRFLPYTADESAKEDIWYGLYEWTERRPELCGLWVSHLKDRFAQRRALAGFLLAVFGDDVHRNAAAALLTDPNPLVRLRIAQGMLAIHDACGVPVLIELLDEPEVELSWSAEELLVWVAGTEAPLGTVGAASDASRARCRAVWREWWENRNRQVDWPADEKPRPGLYLIRSCKNPSDGILYYSRVWLCGCDGKPRWQLTVEDLLTAKSINPKQLLAYRANLLANNRILLSIRTPGDVPQGCVVECDLQGRQKWKSAVGLQAANRFPDGATFDGARALVDSRGAWIRLDHEYSLPLTALQTYMEAYCNRRGSGTNGASSALSLRNGNIVKQTRYVMEEGRIRLMSFPTITEFRPDGAAAWECTTEGIGRVDTCLDLIRLGFDRNLQRPR